MWEKNQSQRFKPANLEEGRRRRRIVRIQRYYRRTQGACG
jgi:hypothetical protein